MQYNGAELCDPKGIAEGYASFFKSVHDPSSLKDFSDLDYQFGNINLREVSVSTVLSCIKKLKSKKSTGVDNIPSDFLAKPIAHIFNLFKDKDVDFFNTDVKALKELTM
ncbi:hypothetical protein JTB14_007185 [Gonioctena quinquepunctata]|nr:hypothetical protein JTB14_007185 [Gonioctena quinquepunctata]